MGLAELGVVVSELPNSWIDTCLDVLQVGRLGCEGCGQRLACTATLFFDGIAFLCYCSAECGLF